MERIKEALARARQERENIERTRPTPVDAPIDTSVEGSETRADGSIEAPGDAPAQRERTAKEPIQYTQTQQLDVPVRKLRRNRVVAALDDSPLAGPYKVLRTQVLHRLRLNGWSAIAVTSPAAGDGKSLTSVNLAVGLAREVNHTVLLVDLDLKSPTLHTYFDYKPELGLSDYILYDAKLPDMLINPGIDGLVVLPGRERIAQSSEALSSQKMVRLVEELKTRYPSRIVLFDVPPLLSGDDMLAFSPYIDAVLLVTRDAKTTTDELSRSMELLDGINILGTVLNESPEPVEAYY